MSQAMQAKCRELVEGYYQAAEAHYGRTFKRVPLIFSNKMTLCGGVATFKAKTFDPLKLTFSMPILLENEQDFYAEVPGHEVAHLIATELYNEDCGHGYKWKRVMAVLGCDDKRTHNMKTSANNINKIPAYCNCVEPHYLTRKRHAILKHVSCNKCKSKLQAHPLTADQKEQHQAHKQAQAEAEANKPVKNIQQGGGKKGSKAELVRDIIRANPNADHAELCVLVTQADTGVKANLIKTYVRENMKRVRG